MGDTLTDEQAYEIFVLWDGGASRSEIADRFGVPVHRIFDRHLEERGRGRLAHPKLADLPIRQGRGGGRKRPPTPNEIAARAAAIRSKTSRDRPMP